MKELICIVCPKGCHLKIDDENGYAVTGNGCPRGAEYGVRELTAPVRVVTSTVYCAGGTLPRCPVKTSEAVPKGAMADVMRAVNSARVTAPVAIGQTVIENVCGTGANVIATRAIPEKQ